MRTQAVVSSTLTFSLLQDHLLTFQHLLEQVHSLASQSLEMPGGFPPLARNRGFGRIMIPEILAGIAVSRIIVFCYVILVKR